MSEYSLNKRQQEAVNHKNGPMMVLAGPGSGKTTVILERVRHLVQKENVEPADILIINFTKAASDQTRSRCERMLGKSHIAIATFHSFFYRIIRSHLDVPVENVILEGEKKEIVKSILADKQLNYQGGDDFLEGLLHEISSIKNDLIDLAYYGSANMSEEDFKTVYKAYEAYKDKSRKLDFDDMAEKCYTLLSSHEKILSIWESKYPYVLIDEFQDVNAAQYKCIRLLCKNHRNLFVVGDDDQSIYRFRGARPEIMFEFEKDFPECKKTVLDVNYRSTDEIIRFASRIISQNSRRFQKDIISNEKSGRKPVILISADVGQEALNIGKKILKDRQVDYNEICVLYRINTQARAFIDAFTSLGIPFKVRDEGPGVYGHFTCRDICAYMKFACDQSDNDSLARIINKPNRYVSKEITAAAGKSKMNLMDYLFLKSGMQKWQLKKFDDMLFEIGQIRNKEPYDAVKYIRSAIDYDGYIDSYCEYRKITPAGIYEILNEIMDSAKGFKTIQEFLRHVEEQGRQEKMKEKERKKDLSGEYGVSLSTMHGAKGMEFEKVFIASCVDGLVPYKRGRHVSDLDEERRLFYVAATRAKNELYISIINSRFDTKMEISPFLSFCENLKDKDKKKKNI